MRMSPRWTPGARGWLVGGERTGSAPEGNNYCRQLARERQPNGYFIFTNEVLQEKVVCQLLAFPGLWYFSLRLRWLQLFIFLLRCATEANHIYEHMYNCESYIAASVFSDAWRSITKYYR